MPENLPRSISHVAHEHPFGDVSRFPFERELRHQRIVGLTILGAQHRRMTKDICWNNARQVLPSLDASGGSFGHNCTPNCFDAHTTRHVANSNGKWRRRFCHVSAAAASAPSAACEMAPHMILSIF